MASDDPGRVFSLLVADALEALIPIVDEWAVNVARHRFGERGRGYTDGYDAGVRAMASEVKDQLIERILLLRA